MSKLKPNSGHLEEIKFPKIKIKISFKIGNLPTVLKVKINFQKYIINQRKK